MERKLGERISTLRKQKGLKQEELAALLEVSAQAVSKWENDQNCPDISLLPQLAQILGVTIDYLLTGEEKKPIVRLVPEEERKNWEDLFLRITMESHDGNKMRVNLPLPLVQAALEAGVNIIENIPVKEMGLQQVMQLVQQGAVGNLVEMTSADGDILKVFVG